jgi:hypothetical protein
MSNEMATTVVYPEMSGEVGHGVTREEELVDIGLDVTLVAVGGDSDGENEVAAGTNVKFSVEGTVGPPLGDEVEFSPTDGSVEIKVGVPIGAKLEGITGLIEGITLVTGTKLALLEDGASVPLNIGADTGPPVEFVVEGAEGLLTGTNVSLALEGATGLEEVMLFTGEIVTGLKAGANVSFSIDVPLVAFALKAARGLVVVTEVSLPLEGTTGLPAAVEFTVDRATGLVVCERVLFPSDGVKVLFEVIAMGEVTDGDMVTTGATGEEGSGACLDESMVLYSAPQVYAVANSTHDPVQMPPL